MDAASAKVTAVVLEGLRAALGGEHEYRLFRAGKLTGLFASRYGTAGEAANVALREGYLEHLRSETRAKIVIPWVRLTPQGIEFLYENDSPRAVLEEMRDMLRSARTGVPTWLDAVLDQLKNLADRFGEEMGRYLQKLDTLGHRVEEALRRVEAGVPMLAEPVQGIVPWGHDALTYLDHRKKSGVNADCAFPELFSALRKRHSKLNIFIFHEGLRLLEENGALQLLPFTGEPGRLPEPEYALLDGSRVLYYVRR